MRSSGGTYRLETKNDAEHTDTDTGSATPKGIVQNPKPITPYNGYGDMASECVAFHVLREREREGERYTAWVQTQFLRVHEAQVVRHSIKLT